MLLEDRDKSSTWILSAPRLCEKHLDRHVSRLHFFTAILWGRETFVWVVCLSQLNCIYRFDVPFLFDQRRLQLTAIGTQNALRNRTCLVSFQYFVWGNKTSCFLKLLLQDAGGRGQIHERSGGSGIRKSVPRRASSAVLTLKSNWNVFKVASSYHLLWGVGASSGLRLLHLLLNLPCSHRRRRGSTVVPEEGHVPHMRSDTETSSIGQSDAYVFLIG